MLPTQQIRVLVNINMLQFYCQQSNHADHTKLYRVKLYSILLVLFPQIQIHHNYCINSHQPKAGEPIVAKEYLFLFYSDKWQVPARFYNSYDWIQSPFNLWFISQDFTYRNATSLKHRICIWCKWAAPLTFMKWQLIIYLNWSINQEPNSAI